jgi:hypothetical protein
MSDLVAANPAPKSIKTTGSTAKEKTWLGAVCTRRHAKPTEPATTLFRRGLIAEELGWQQLYFLRHVFENNLINELSRKLATTLL